MMRPLGSLLLVLALTTPLAAQEQALLDTTARGPRRTGWSFGITAIQGSDWNPTAFEAALVKGVGQARARSVYLGARLGGWTNEQTGLSGSTRGWSLGLISGFRTSLVTLMEIGHNERDLDYALLTGTFELTGNLDHNSPTPDAAHATAALLFGLTFSDGGTVDQSFAVLLGPAAYIGGSSTDMRLQVGVRFQSPLGRR